MREDIIDAMGESSHEVSEGGRVFRCLSLETQKELVSRSGLTPRELSILALENGIIPLKYLKNIGTIGTDGQASLLESKVPLSLIHISEPTRLGMISYAVFCLKKKKEKK